MNNKEKYEFFSCRGISANEATKLYPNTTRFVDEFYIKIDKMISKWVCSLAAKNVHMKSYYGDQIAYVGVAYSGSVRDVFISFFDPFITNDGINVLRTVGKRSREVGYDVTECVDEGIYLMKNATKKIYNQIYYKDRQMCKWQGGEDDDRIKIFIQKLSKVTYCYDCERQIIIDEFSRSEHMSIKINGNGNIIGNNNNSHVEIKSSSSDVELLIKHLDQIGIPKEDLKLLREKIECNDIKFDKESIIQWLKSLKTQAFEKINGAVLTSAVNWVRDSFC